MAEYRPAAPFSVAAELLIPIYTKKQGVPTKAFPASGDLFYASFRSFGGTERNENGLYSIIDTATMETWFRPDIKSDCRVKIGEDVYEILGSPENINLRNQYLKFKVRRMVGGA